MNFGQLRFEHDGEWYRVDVNHNIEISDSCLNWTKVAEPAQPLSARAWDLVEDHVRRLAKSASNERRERLLSQRTVAVSAGHVYFPGRRRSLTVLTSVEVICDGKNVPLDSLTPGERKRLPRLADATTRQVYYRFTDRVGA